jgi:hypothetical protein
MKVKKEEISLGKLDSWSEENWAKVTEEQRKRCVKALRTELEAEVDRPLLDLWRDQYARGMQIGSDNPFFHMSPGMWIRNILRKEVEEGNLPWVEYPGGKLYKNWDDFYRAALREALGLDAAKE